MESPLNIINTILDIRVYCQTSGRWNTNDTVDLSVYFAEYEALIDKLGRLIEKTEGNGNRVIQCGQEADACFYKYFDLPLREAIYLISTMNRLLKSDRRVEVIRVALEIYNTIEETKNRLESKEKGADAIEKKLSEAYTGENILCPLNIGIQSWGGLFQRIRPPA